MSHEPVFGLQRGDGISREIVPNSVPGPFLPGQRIGYAEPWGRYFQHFGTLRGRYAGAKNGAISTLGTTGTVGTLFPISGVKAEKKGKREKGKVEIKKYRPHRPHRVRPATARASAEVAG